MPAIFFFAQKRQREALNKAEADGQAYPEGEKEPDHIKKVKKRKRTVYFF